MMSVGVRTPTEQETVIADDRPYAISADQFFEMIEAGVFPEEARVYLRDGRIFEKMAKTRAHSVVGGMLHEALFRRLPGGWKIFSEGEFRLDDANAVLPDLAVVRGEDFRSFLAPGRYPKSGDIGLVIEIAVTSLAKDLGPNLRRYAQGMVPTYWVADVGGGRILSHTGPRFVDGRGEYGQVVTVKAGETLPLVLDGQEVARFPYEELMP